MELKKQYIQNYIKPKDEKLRSTFGSSQNWYVKAKPI
jgi:hypothetical protein